MVYLLARHNYITSGGQVLGLLVVENNFKRKNTYLKADQVYFEKNNLSKRSTTAFPIDLMVSFFVVRGVYA